jgi:hypothetical protein
LWVATRGVFSEQQLVQLRGSSQIGRVGVVRYFTLTPADAEFVRTFHGPGNAVLSAAVQLCTLPWLGFVPDEVQAAPPVAVARLAERLGMDADALHGYGMREQTRTDHLRLIARYSRWRAMG